MHIQKRTMYFLLFSFSMLLFLALPYSFRLFHTVQEKIVDRFYIDKPQSTNVVVIAIDDASIAHIGQWPWPRDVYANVLTHLLEDPTNLPKAIGIDISFSERSRIAPEDDLVLANALRTYKEKGIPVVLPADINTNGSIISEPIEMLKTESQLGFINIPLDRDGVARNIETTRKGTSLHSFSHVLSAFPAPAAFRIDYRGEHGFLTVPFTDVAEQRIPNRIFKDKIVLIGATAPNLHDVVNTPLTTVPGVLVNAHAIETILQETYYQDLPYSLSLLLIAFITLGVCILVRYIKKIIPLIGILTLFLALIITASSVAFTAYIILPVLYLILAFFGALFGALLFEYITESKEKAFIHKSFQYYLTPHVINQLMEHPEKLSLGGESRHMTILFSDIRGFTTLSEALTPQELTQLLNDYLTAMTDIIMAHNGVVDKYIGDAVMAFWGAPLDNANQATDACTSAVKMIQELTELNKTFPHKLNIGIGLNTGTVVVGNMGSKKRFNYTVMGDDVNLASRLESLTKYYGVQTIVSEATRKECPDLLFRELDLVIVKGKKEPRRIFELIAEETSEPLQKALKFFEQGRLAYTKGDWEKAITCFEKAVTVHNDGPSKLFIERCKKLRKHPPKDWNGVYQFESK